MAPSIVHRIPLPNPFFEGEINTWLIDVEPLTLIDAGLGTSESRQQLHVELAHHGRRLEDIRRLILTHRHPDHIGLASYIVDQSGAEVWMHPADLLDVTHLEQQSAAFPEKLVRQLAIWGVPAEQITHVERFFTQAPKWAHSVAAHPIEEGAILPSSAGDLLILHTPGHTPGSISIHFQNYLFCGDHVLERISPNVGAAEFETPGMLTKYLDSLAKVARLDAPDLLICPGHGPAFSGLAARCQYLIQHHREREQKILAWLTDNSPASVFQVASYLFGEMPQVHLMLGTGEAYVHLEKLRDQGDLHEPSPGTFQRI